jgi:hypothetical protein
MAMARSCWKNDLPPASGEASGHFLKRRMSKFWQGGLARDWSATGLPKPVMSLLKQHQMEYENDTNG